MDPSCCYDKVVSLVAFDNHFELAGGINLPKVLSCTGSDGRRRKQLVKVCGVWVLWVWCGVWVWVLWVWYGVWVWVLWVWCGVLWYVCVWCVEGKKGDVSGF